MKKFILMIGLLLSGYVQAQEYIGDSKFDDAIHEKSAFGDDETSIIVIEFWAQFNDANSFKDWNKLKNITHYYRVDIANAPKAKKDYRVRMAPTIIIFKDGVDQKYCKAGIDLECPVDLRELQEAIDDVKTASQF